MTREQFVVVIFGFLIVAAIAVWLMWHLIWRPVWKEWRAKRRPCPICGQRECQSMTCMTAIQDEINRVRSRIRKARLYHETTFTGGPIAPTTVWPSNGAFEGTWPNYSAPPLDWKRDRLL